MQKILGHNQYFFLRHGESLKNIKNIASCWPEKFYSPLTKKGERQIKEAAERLKNKKISFIFTSDLLRTKQTAEIVGKELGIKPKFDKRLREINYGILNGKSAVEVRNFWDSEEKLSAIKYTLKRFQKAPPRGETYARTEKRMLEFIKEIDKKYQGKSILIVGHQRPFTLLEKAVYGYDLKKFTKIVVEKKEIEAGEFRKLLWI